MSLISNSSPLVSRCLRSSVTWIPPWQVHHLVLRKWWETVQLRGSGCLKDNIMWISLDEQGFLSSNFFHWYYFILVLSYSVMFIKIKTEKMKSSGMHAVELCEDVWVEHSIFCLQSESPLPHGTTTQIFWSCLASTTDSSFLIDRPGKMLMYSQEMYIWFSSAILIGSCHSTVLKSAIEPYTFVFSEITGFLKCKSDTITSNRQPRV